MFYSLLSIQILTLSYHQITTIFDFFPFNSVRHYSIKERNKEALVNGIIMIIAIIFSLTNISVLIGIGGVIWSLVLVGAVLNWWLPYTTGRDFFKLPNNETWVQMNERIFANTVQIMPNIKNNPKPNLEHVILHMLILGSSILSWVYFFTV